MRIKRMLTISVLLLPAMVMAQQNGKGYGSVPITPCYVQGKMIASAMPVNVCQSKYKGFSNKAQSLKMK